MSLLVLSSNSICFSLHGSECCSGCALLAEVDEGIRSDSLRSVHPKIVSIMRLVSRGGHVRKPRCRQTSHRSLSTILKIDVGIVFLQISRRKRRLKSGDRLRSLISARMQRIIASLLISVVRTVLRAAK